MRPTVRGAGSRDLEALLPLVEQFQAFERIPFDAAAARQNLARLLESPQLGQALLAEMAGRPIGYAILTYGYDLEFGGMDAYRPTSSWSTRRAIAGTGPGCCPGSKRRPRRPASRRST
jgi:hypothetical protein